ncbi:MAG: class A beta-lactamase-related serine hydrolase [Chitinophagaceae bacterium]|nr:MAG: class A beta-lactamase-related serine hydrolase [Chitinophagaceae bacterium]
MHKRIFIFFCFLLAGNSYAQQVSTAAKDLQQFVRQKGDSLLQAEKLPGILVGVLDGNSRQFFSFGFADPANKLSFDSATIFEAGSITKTFTAYLLQTVLQEKGISDTTSILPYLPDSVQGNKALAPVTFLSLLNHTSGLPRLPANFPLASTAPYDKYTAADLFAFLKQSKPAPDGKSNYSNLGAGLAGWLAQSLSGKAYKTILHDYIFGPFSMKDAAAATGRKAQGHFGTTQLPFWNMDVLFPAGGLQCSASDILHYLARMSQPQREKSVHAAVVEKLLQPTATVSPVMHIGRAWFGFTQTDKPTIYWHNGGTYGFSTFAGFSKGTSQAVIVVVNQFNKNTASDGLGIAILQKMME